MQNIIPSNRLFLCILLVLLITTCSKDSPSESSINSEKLKEAFAQAEQFSGLKSLLVAKDGEIVREQYWKSGGPDNPHDVRSVTKSVIAILVGIATDKGYLQSIDQTVGEFIEADTSILSYEKSKIKILHLLTMSSGFSWEELINISEYNKWISSPNQVEYLLKKPLVNQPGKTFVYNSAALHLLSVIISNSTSMTTQNFANKYLFEPIGTEQKYWQTDFQGYYNGGAGLSITPHDMIKIGQLILNRGEYNGKRIVSSEWIDQMISLQISTNNSQPYGPNYGYCWWIGQNEKGNYTFANGWGGQFIVVVPSLKLIVSATNEWSGVSTSNANAQWSRTINLIMESIVTAF